MTDVAAKLFSRALVSVAWLAFTAFMVAWTNNTSWAWLTLALLFT